jgi:spoIIIJ-associated protein
MEMPADNEEIVEIVRDVLGKLLELMAVPASVTSLPEFPVGGEDEATGSIALNVEGDELGILIGRRGQTLSCLQYLVRLIVGHQTGVWLPIIIDVESYKQRRCHALQDLAWRMADQVKLRQEPFSLEPMPAFDRRIIHLTLADHPDVITESSGVDEARRVVILPKRNQPD